MAPRGTAMRHTNIGRYSRTPGTPSSSNTNVDVGACADGNADISASSNPAEKTVYHVRRTLSNTFMHPEVKYDRFIEDIVRKVDLRGYNIPLLYIAHTVFTYQVISDKWTNMPGPNLTSRMAKFLGTLDLESVIGDQRLYSHVRKDGYTYDMFSQDVKVHLGYICWISSMDTSVSTVSTIDPMFVTHDEYESD